MIPVIRKVETKVNKGGNEQENKGGNIQENKGGNEENRDGNVQENKAGNEQEKTEDEEMKKRSRKKRNKKTERQVQFMEDSTYSEPEAFSAYERFSQLLTSRKKKQSRKKDFESITNLNQNEKLGQLCACLEHGHFELAEKIVNSGVDVNKNLDGKYPLCFALKNSECTLDVVKLIIDAGFPARGVVDKRNNLTGLHEAVKTNNITAVEYLTTMAADPNAKDNKGLTPLHYAAKLSNMDLIKVLVKHGADLDAACDKNYPPLFYAMAALNYDSVRLLLSLGANFDRLWKNGEESMAPIHFAAGLHNVVIVKQLVSKGANVNSVIPETGQTTLHLVLEKTKLHMKERIPATQCIVHLLVSSGANVNVKDNAGTSVLEQAIKNSHNFAAKVFIMRSDISLNTDDNFLKILKTCDVTLVRKSLEYGGDYMLKTEKGQFIINALLAPSHVARLISLYSEKTFLHSRRPLGSTLVHILKLFWKSGFPVEYTLIDSDIATHVTKGLMGYVRKSVNCHKMLLSGVELLNTRMIKQAITNGANVRNHSAKMPFPLHYLAGAGNDSCLQFYLYKTVNVNFLDDQGRTALQVAAMTGNVKCCELLLEKGAIFNGTSKKCPETPYQLAKAKEHVEVMKLLGKVGSVFQSVKKEGKLKKIKTHFKAIMNCRDRRGKTLLETALQHGKVSVAQYLLKRRMTMRH